MRSLAQCALIAALLAVCSEACMRVNPVDPGMPGEFWFDPLFVSYVFSNIWRCGRVRKFERLCPVVDVLTQFTLRVQEIITKYGLEKQNVNCSVRRMQVLRSIPHHVWR